MQPTITISRTAVAPRHHARTGSNVTLWVVQSVLAGIFLFGGGFKLVMPAAALTQQIPVSGTFLKLIGVLEVAGGLGLILPGILRRGRYLIPLAATGLVLIMCGAVGVTLAIGGGAQAFMPVLVGVLLTSVAYGRRAELPRAR